MTTPTTRLAGIAERHAKASGPLGLHNRHAYGEQAYKDIPYLLAELTAAQECMLAQAKLMREAAQALEGAIVILPIPATSKGPFCRRCRKHTKDMVSGIVHTPDCLVTKLRTRADELEGRT